MNTAKHGVARPMMLAAALWVFFTGVYSLIGLLRHGALFTGGYDLGIFTQYAQSFAAGRWPVSPIRAPGIADYPLFADHISPILLVLGPIYKVAPYAESLLIVQAMLVAASVSMILMISHRVWHNLTIALGVAIAYGCSFGLVNLVMFDFHEIAFAIPLLTLSLGLLVQRRYLPALLTGAGLILVKEDLGLMTAGIAGLVFLRCARLRVPAVGVAALGVVATFGAIFWLIPQFNIKGINTFAAEVDPMLITQSARLKFTTVLTLLAPVLGLCLRSPILLLALPTMAWRFMADIPSYWRTGYHYDAILIPIVFLAFVDAMQATALPIMRRVVAGMLGMAVLISLVTPMRAIYSAKSWQPSPDSKLAITLINCIPPRVSVATMNGYASHLVATNETRLIGYLREATPDVVLITTGGDVFPYKKMEIEDLRQMALDRGLQPRFILPRATGGDVELMALPSVTLNPSCATGSAAPAPQKSNGKSR